ncbi:MAG: DUF6232 family protein [Eubacterium sp.]
MDANQKESINTPSLKIEKNCLSFQNTFLAINNISQVTVAPIPKDRFPMSAIVMGALGMLGFIIKIPMAGLVCLLIGVGIGFIWYSKNNNTGLNLNIFLNSGNILSIHGDDAKFLNKIRDVLMYCANNNYEQQINVDFSHSTIDNSPITFGSSNEVKNER